jgi:hypothetical protein
MLDDGLGVGRFIGGPRVFLDLHYGILLGNLGPVNGRSEWNSPSEPRHQAQNRRVAQSEDRATLKGQLFCGADSPALDRPKGQYA